MSTEQARRTLNQLNKEIADLEKKSAVLFKKEVTARGNAARIQKSISKNASVSTLRTKQSQINRYNNEVTKAARDRADTDRKIADKKKKQATAIAKLQNEEATEKKKDEKAQKALRQRYEQRIDELTSQMSQTTLSSPATGQRHLYSEQGDEKYDVFVSHASEDKESIAKPLFEALQRKGIEVWYDAISVGWGDSLRGQIDKGLKNSKFGIVIISNYYINKGWTQYELDGLFQKERTNGKTILPIWHNISKDEVQAFSPTLVGRKALTTAQLSAEEIADELVKLLPSAELKEATNGMEETHQ